MEKSVLLVDDKQEIAKIIMLYLSSTYKVSYKENPLKAIAWLQEGHIPVLILSSVESSSNRIRLFEEGAEDFILKPFNPEELRVRVKRILR